MDTKIPKPVLLLLLVDVALILLHLIFQLEIRSLEKVSILFNLDSEIGIATWFSSVQFFLSFCLATAFAYNEHRKNSKIILIYFLPLLFLAMSIEEIVQVHEWLGWQIDRYFEGFARKNTIFKRTGIWAIVLGVPFGLLFLLFIWRLKPVFTKNQKPLIKLIVGMTGLLGGAIGIELGSNFAEGTALIWSNALEEGFELFGSTIMLWAVYEANAPTLPNLISELLTSEKGKS